MPLSASWTNRLAAGRRPASRSRIRDKHTICQLHHTMHSTPCHNLLSSGHAHLPPPLPSSAEATWQPASLTASTWRRKMAQCWHALHVVWLCRLFRSSLWMKYICEVEWSFRSRWRWIIKRETNLAHGRVVVVLRVACVFTSISNFRYMVGLFDCSISYYLLMMDYVSISLFYNSLSSPYFAHFVAEFISSHVVI